MDYFPRFDISIPPLFSFVRLLPSLVGGEREGVNKFHNYKKYITQEPLP